MNGTYVMCRYCRTQMVAPVDRVGRVAICSTCERALRLPMMTAELQDGHAYPAPLACRPEEETAEHLRVIRCYVGWLLVCAAVPVVLGLGAFGLWIAIRIVASLP